jgi:predicted nuclease of predicted toxin-antitoxin system
LSFKLCARLADLFPGSSQVRLLGLVEAEDRAVWNYADGNGFTLVSLDVDFADRATLIGPPPKVIWLRCGDQPTENIEKLLRDHLDAIIAFERHAAACLEIYQCSLWRPKFALLILAPVGAFAKLTISRPLSERGSNR